MGRGDSNVVSNEYLVDFEGKGINVKLEEHEITLMNSRNHRNKNNKIDYSVPQNMMVDDGEISKKSQIKKRFEDKMKTQISERQNLINNAKKRKQRFMEQLKIGNIDALIHE